MPTSLKDCKTPEEKIQFLKEEQARLSSKATEKQPEIPLYEKLEEWKSTGIIKNFDKETIDFSSLSNVERTSWPKKLIVRNCPNLKYLDISDLGLEKVDIFNCSELKELNAANNEIDDITFREVDKLETIYLNNNKLSSFDTINLPAIKALDVSANKLTNLKLTNHEKLETLNCGINELTSFNFLNNCENLKFLACYSNKLDLFNNKPQLNHLKKLKYLYCQNSGVRELKIDGFKNLKVLSCFGKVFYEVETKENNPLFLFFSKQVFGLKTVKIRKCENLEIIDIAEGIIDDLELIDLPNLENVSVKQNSLESLEIHNCPKLDYLDYSRQGKWERKEKTRKPLLITPYPTLTAISGSPNLNQLYYTEKATFYDEQYRLISQEQIWNKFPKLKIFTSEMGGENPAFDEWIDKREQEIEQEKQRRAMGNNPIDSDYFSEEEQKKKKNNEPIINDPSLLENKNKYPNLLEVYGKESEMTITGQGLTGVMIIDGYQGRKINVGNNFLSYLVVRNCPNLTTLRYAHNAMLHDAWYEPQEFNNPNLTIIDKYKYNDPGINTEFLELFEKGELKEGEKFNKRLKNAKKNKEKQQGLEEKLFKTFIEIIEEAERAADNGNWKKVEKNIKFVKESPQLLLIQDKEKVKEIYERVNRLEARLQSALIQSQSTPIKLIIVLFFTTGITLTILLYLANKIIKKWWFWYFLILNY